MDRDFFDDMADRSDVRDRRGIGYAQDDYDDDDDDHNSETVPRVNTVKMDFLESNYEHIAEELKKLSDEMRFVFYKMEWSLLEENHVQYLNNVKELHKLHEIRAELEDERSWIQRYLLQLKRIWHQPSSNPRHQNPPGFSNEYYRKQALKPFQAQDDDTNHNPYMASDSVDAEKNDNPPSRGRSTAFYF